MVSRSWNSELKFNRLTSLALCFGVAFLLLAGSAMAQGLTAVPATANYATQVGGVGLTYTLPANTVTRTMGVARAAGQNFFLHVTLPTGFTFNALGLPAAGNVALTTAGGGAIGAVTIFSGGGAGQSFVRFLIPVTTAFATAPTFTVTCTAWVLNDVGGLLSGTSATNQAITLQTFDSATGIEFDSGTNAVTWIRSINGLGATITATTAVVDTAAASGRRNFVVPNGTDTATQDNDATITITNNASLDRTGAAYVHLAADSFTLAFTGNLSGLVDIRWAPGTGNQVIDTVTAGEVTGNATTMTIPGANAALPGAGAASVVPIRFTVDNVTQLTARTIQVQVNSVIAANAANNRTLAGPGNATVWSVNGTVLLSNWVNANAAYFASRVYVWNPTSTANAQVSIRVFTLPLPGSGNAVQLGGTLVLTPTVGANSGMTLRLWEDILTPLGVGQAAALGVDGNGNVVVEVTIMALNCSGYSQVINTANLNSYGTTPLYKIQ